MFVLNQLIRLRNLLFSQGYLEHETDQRVLLSAMKIARRLLRTKPLAPYFDHEIYPGEDIQSDDELMQIARGTRDDHVPPRWEHAAWRHKMIRQQLWMISCVSMA